MPEILSSQTFLLTLTLGVYLAARWLYMRSHFFLFHPVLLSMGAIMLFLWVSGIPYPVYMQQTQLIDFMLGLSVVALGYLLHQQINQVRGNLTVILTALVVGSAVGIASVVGIARWMGSDQAIIASLQPKSVTMAIAVRVSESSGGIPALTSVVVILVGIFGGLAGPFILRLIGIESPLARGLALGAGAHALGTARAMELGAVEGAIGGLAIGLMGIITALMISLMHFLG